MNPGNANPRSGLWKTQLLAVIEMEIRRCFLGRRAIGVWILAALPVLLVGLIAWLWPNAHTYPQMPMFYAQIFHSVILPLDIFLGCAWIFTNTFRGEITDRSLHYLFLAPVRRDVLLVGKYLAALAGAVIFFGTSTLATYLIYFLRLPSGSLMTHLTNQNGLTHLSGWVGVALLGCVAYGTIFLLIGLIAKSPFVPVLGFMMWERVNDFLPPILKRASVVYYLASMAPVSAPEGPFAVIDEPPSALWSIPGLLLFSVILLGVAIRKLRKLEISYGME